MTTAADARQQRQAEAGHAKCVSFLQTSQEDPPTAATSTTGAGPTNISADPSAPAAGDVTGEANESAGAAANVAAAYPAASAWPAAREGRSTNQPEPLFMTTRGRSLRQAQQAAALSAAQTRTPIAASPPTYALSSEVQPCRHAVSGPQSGAYPGVLLQ